MVHDAEKSVEGLERSDQLAVSAPGNQPILFSAKRMIPLFAGVGLGIASSVLASFIDFVPDLAWWGCAVGVFWVVAEWLRYEGSAHLKDKPRVSLPGSCLSSALVILVGMLFSAWLLLVFLLFSTYLGVLLLLHSLGRFKGFKRAFPPREAWENCPRRHSRKLALLFFSITITIVCACVLYSIYASGSA